MNTHLLINNIVQRTMVFVAQLATSGGVRAPLANIADEVFRNLTQELESQGVSKKVIADMFGLGLRTYRRRVQSVGQSKSAEGRTVWEAVFDFVREREPVSGAQVLKRFAYDDTEIITGVLNDFVQSGLVYRAGRGESAMYRVAEETDFEPGARQQAHRFVVWLAAYRGDGLSVEAIAAETQLSPPACQEALGGLVAEGVVSRQETGSAAADSAPQVVTYHSDSLELPWGSTQGWEAAVLDHFQALVSAVTQKLNLGDTRAELRDEVGGSTWSLDIWQGHPLEKEARGTLARLRNEVENLRSRIDNHNQQNPPSQALTKVVVYLGQYLRSNDTENIEADS